MKKSEFLKKYTYWPRSLAAAATPSTAEMAEQIINDIESASIKIGWDPELKPARQCIEDVTLRCLASLDIRISAADLNRITGRILSELISNGHIKI